jgi:SSS family solute:Na+ symporter
VEAYVFLGGLLSAIFNEVLQFSLIWLGALLIPILGLIEAGWWNGMVARIQQNFPGQDYNARMAHAWFFSATTRWASIVLGLGWVVSFGYWTTDFLVVQRGLSACNLHAARMAPIMGSGFKMLVPFIVILPPACCAA